MQSSASVTEFIEKMVIMPSTPRPEVDVEVPTHIKQWSRSITGSPSINNNVSSLSTSSTARKFDRQLDNGSAAILIQRIREQTASQSTSEVLVMSPNPSATVNC